MTATSFLTSQHWPHIITTSLCQNAVSDSSIVDITQLLHVIFPRQSLQPGKYTSLPAHVTHVVGVLHNSDHYALMEINIAAKKVLI
jgi:hypothetical protein